MILLLDIAFLMLVIYLLQECKVGLEDQEFH